MLATMGSLQTGKHRINNSHTASQTVQDETSKRCPQERTH